MNHRIWRRSALSAILLTLIALTATGCSSDSSSSRAALRTGASWPGMTIAEDVAYLAFNDAVYAIDPDTQEEIWVYSAESNRKSLFGGRSMVLFFAEPAVGDGLVVVGDYSETLHAIDAESGEQQWTLSTDRVRFIGGAVIGEGIVYAGAADGKLYALDAESGEALWTFEAQDSIWDAPLLADGVLYVSSLDRNLYAINAEDGSLLWQFEASGALVGTPTLNDDALYFGSLDRTIYALEADNGQLLWEREVSGWVWDSPAVADGLLVAGDLDGVVYGLDAEDGTEVWQFETEGPVVGTPLIDNGTAYFASGDAKVYAVDVESGKEHWTPVTIEAAFTIRFLFFDTGIRIRPVPVYSPLALQDDKLLVSLHQGNDLLQALKTEDGSPEWAFEPGQGSRAIARAEGAEEEEELTFQQRLTQWALILIPWLLMLLLLSRRPRPEGK